MWRLETPCAGAHIKMSAHCAIQGKQCTSIPYRNYSTVNTSTAKPEPAPKVKCHVLHHKALATTDACKCCVEANKRSTPRERRSPWNLSAEVTASMSIIAVRAKWGSLPFDPFLGRNPRSGEAKVAIASSAMPAVHAWTEELFFFTNGVYLHGSHFWHASSNRPNKGNGETFSSSTFDTSTLRLMQLQKRTNTAS